MATRTANVIDLAAYRAERSEGLAAPHAPEEAPPGPPAMPLPYPLVSPVPGYWLLWMPVVLPHYFMPQGAHLHSR